MLARACSFRLQRLTCPQKAAGRRGVAGVAKAVSVVAGWSIRLDEIRAKACMRLTGRYFKTRPNGSCGRDKREIQRGVASGMRRLRRI